MKNLIVFMAVLALTLLGSVAMADHIVGGQFYLNSPVPYPAMDIRNNGGGAAAVFSGGNVGIGTTTPYYQLEVVGDVAVRGGQFYLNSPVLYPAMDIRNNGGGAAAVFSGGNVGIGTATPTAGFELDVAGDIMADDVWVDVDGNLVSLVDLIKAVSQPGASGIAQYRK